MRGEYSLIGAWVAIVVLAGWATAVAQGEGAQRTEVSLDHGIVWRSGDDSSLRVTVGGRLSVDARFFDDDNRKRSGVRLGDFIPAVSASWGRFDAHVRADVRGVEDRDRVLREAWIRWSSSDAFRVTAGQLKVDFGSEVATSLGLLSLPGRSFVGHLNGVIDTGVRIDGFFCVDDGELLHWAAFATAGTGYGFEGDRVNDPIFGARAIVRPFAGLGVAWLAGVRVGGSLAYSPDYRDGLHLVTPLESTVFDAPRVRARRAVRRNIEFAYHYGPVRARLAIANLAILGARARGGVGDLDQNGAWSGELAAMITGQPYAYREGREAGVDVAPVGTDGSIGGIELAVRYSNADIDRAWFSRGITQYDPSAQEMRTFTAGLNWYVRRNMRAMIAWVHTISDDRLTTFRGDHRDRSLLLRLQVRF